MGFRYIASATQNGILNCAMRISGGAGILLVVAMRWLPAIWIEATSLPEIPYWLRRSRIASTAVWAVMWQEKRFIIIVKVRKVSPSPRVNSARSLSLQNALRNPAPPSSTVLGPVKPSAARLAARTPPSAARPRCNRFTMAPFPLCANSKCVDHLRRIEVHQLSARDSRPERSQCARRVKTAHFVCPLGRASYTNHHFSPGDEGCEQVASVHSAFLRYGQPRGDQ